MRGVMSTAFKAGERSSTRDVRGLARHAWRVPTSASKVHPVAVVAEYVEDPIGLQCPDSCHEIKSSPTALCLPADFSRCEWEGNQPVPTLAESYRAIRSGRRTQAAGA
jgi:hypothetical protein